MYIGVDFLFDRDRKLYLSEVNTGVPGGAQEYDFVHRAKFGKPSGVFEKIESLSRKVFNKNFYDHIHSLSYIDDLRALKIWMDGEGPLPKKPSPALRLEDKWVQYLILSGDYPMVSTEIFRKESLKSYEKFFSQGNPVVLKRRLGRGGKGFLLVRDISGMKKLDVMDHFYLVQPFLESQIGSLKLSVRAAAFAGRFISMFANLSPRMTSNHGFRFYVSAGDDFRLSNMNFKVRKIFQKAWEAEIFFKGEIPEYLYHNVFEEEIAEAELIIPDSVYQEIKRISASISRFYQGLDFKILPKSFIEEQQDVF